MFSPGWAHFRPQEHYFNKIGTGPLDDASYQYQGSSPCRFREDFFMFPYTNLCKTCDPWGG